MTHKPTISDKVLERIKDTQPYSRTYFMVRNIGMWSLAGLSILIGGLAISSTIFRVANAPAALRPGVPPISELLLVMPFLWLIVLGGFGYLAYREIRSTRKGYKYEFTTLMLGTLLASFVFGILFYVTGMGFLLDRFAARHVPFHPDLERVQQDRWLNPRDGFLVGVIEDTSENGIEVTDPGNVVWQVSFAESVSDEQIAVLSQGERIGIRGVLLDVETHMFLACAIRSLEFEGRGSVPPPERLFARGERNTPPPRSTECEGVRPLTY
jgi:hypothetical protein